MKNFIIKKRSSFFVAFSIIFWLIVSFATILFIIFSFVSKMNHDKKWSYYDDCGVF